ncbi:MAG: divalent-cation tolerance protein CutA [Candidatus Obscuribacterales bacterium]|nr:divalent-cation tolerance protein CutA [Candidatus Obscuribacterales bacterium]
MTGELVAFVTCPPDKAESLAVQIVESKLAACVNIVPGITSVYLWEGELNKDGESLLIMKTNKSVYDKFESKIKSLHPYEVPEILCLPIESGSRAYLDWLNKCLV